MLFRWGFKNSHVMNANMFKMMSDLLLLILKVGSEKRPLITHIAHVHPDKTEDQIVYIWAGVGHGASPMKRIKELIEENESLRMALKESCNNDANHEKVKKYLKRDEL